MKNRSHVPLAQWHVRNAVPARLVAKPDLAKKKGLIIKLESSCTRAGSARVTFSARLGDLAGLGVLVRHQVDKY